MEIINFNNAMVLIVLLLLVVAFNDVPKKTKNYFFDSLRFFQRLLNYVFVGFFIRQILNPYFLFPFSLIASVYLYKNQKLVEPEDIILFVTFLAILWYSRETFLLREEQGKSNKILAGRPLVIISKEVGNYINIKNFGNSIAKSIVVKIFLENKEKFNAEFLVLGEGQDIRYPIEPFHSDLIDECNKNLYVEIQYRSFSSRMKFVTKFITDEKILIDSEKGRFKISDDREVKIM